MRDRTGEAKERKRREEKKREEKQGKEEGGEFLSLSLSRRGDEREKRERKRTRG
jgi:hypothetical protein